MRKFYFYSQFLFFILGFTYFGVEANILNMLEIFKNKYFLILKEKIEIN